MGRNLSLMIKPASSKCNLKCKYCFYNSIADERNVKDYGFIKVEVLEEIVKKAISYCGDGNCTIGFQGGEPTLIGLDFYKNLINFVKKYNKKTKINYFLQTNGILINDEWAKFLKENSFLVGISLDGNKEVHNINRVDYLNRKTFNKVIKATEILEKYNVDFNILVVVTSELRKKIDSCYNLFKKKNFRYLQFIPYLEPLKSRESKNKYSLSSSEYGIFLNRLFDLWYRDIMNGEFMSIRFFDNILGVFLGYSYESCDMNGVCSCQNIIESDGSVYPCDFYTYEYLRVGNIIYENFEEIHNKESTISFIKSSINTSIKCKVCKYSKLCRGGCRRHRENQEDGLNYFCSAYYDFFDKTAQKFYKIAMKIASKY